MRAKLLVLLGSVLACSSGMAADAPLLKCRELSAPPARLACYDAIPAAAVAAAGPAPTGKAPGDAGPGAAADGSFGLPVNPASSGTQTVHAALDAEFAGWQPNQRLRLDNGQVWQITDGSSMHLDRGARKVTVRRGAFSAYYLNIEGLNTSPRVRRIE